MKFNLLFNVKIPTIVGILTCVSHNKYIYAPVLKQEKIHKFILVVHDFSYNEQLKFYAQFELSMKNTL